MFEIPLQTLPFLILFSFAIALFHTVIVTGLFGLDLKPRWILYIIDPLLLVLAFFLVPQYSGIVFIALFLSVFLLGIIAFMKSGFEAVLEKFKESRSQKKPLWKVLLGGFMILFFYLGFFYFGIYSFFIILFLIIMSSVLPSNKNRYFFYQRNLPTSKIKSAAVGLAEICGKAKALEYVISPLYAKKCVGCIYTVDKISHSRDKDGRTSTSYREISRKVDINKFLLTDDSGSIEVHPENLEWISFTATNETSDGDKRYREFILDEKTDVLLVGQVYYEGAKNIFRYDENTKVFGMAMLDLVNFANKWRPLKLRAIATILCAALFTAFVLIIPMKVQGTKLIIKSINFQEQLFKNPFDIFN